jgi:hypothetical protein
MHDAWQKAETMTRLSATVLEFIPGLPLSGHRWSHVCVKD